MLFLVLTPLFVMGMVNSVSEASEAPRAAEGFRASEPSRAASGPLTHSAPGSMQDVFEDIDRDSAKYIERLAEAVAIPSVSSDPSRRKDVVRMSKWVLDKLRKLGANVQLEEVGTQTMGDGTVLSLPPLVVGYLGNDPAKKTLLIYGHMDVQPAEMSDGWETNPFVLTEKDGKLFGRGSTDDKGPIVAWINAIEAMQARNVEIPVNIKFCFEGMEESGSEGLEDYLKSVQNTFLADVDFTVISDNYWLGKNKPCITYGLRGINYFTLEVSGPRTDLHSGVFGGTVHEPMNDLVTIMSQLADNQGRIMVPGINEMVPPMTCEEREEYEKMDFTVEEYKETVGGELYTRSKVDVLSRRWREPSLSIHGIEGAFSGAGTKTVIPAKVTGKFSIRLVPDMSPDEVTEKVTEYVHDLWKERGSPNNYEIRSVSSAKWWLGDRNSTVFEASERALKNVFSSEVNWIREGGSIPSALMFQELTGKSTALLPIGASDDMAHAPNEKIDVKNYIQGTKVLVSLLLELGK